jgi:hypothetical protein
MKPSDVEHYRRMYAEVLQDIGKNKSKEEANFLIFMVGQQDWKDAKQWKTIAIIQAILLGILLAIGTF